MCSVLTGTISCFALSWLCDCQCRHGDDQPNLVELILDHI